MYQKALYTRLNSFLAARFPVYMWALYTLQMFCCSPANLGWGGTGEGEHPESLACFISDSPRLFDNLPFLGWDRSLCHDCPGTSFFVSLPLTPAVRRWKGDGRWEKMYMRSLPATSGGRSHGWARAAVLLQQIKWQNSCRSFLGLNTVYWEGDAQAEPLALLKHHLPCTAQLNSKTLHHLPSMPATPFLPCLAFDVSQDKSTQKLSETFTCLLQHQRIW